MSASLTSDPNDPSLTAPSISLLLGQDSIDATLTFVLTFAESQADERARQLIAGHAIPATEPRDAAHISLAAVNGLEYLVTWNFKHIANAATRDAIESICRDTGYEPPTICAPDELSEAWDAH